MSINPSSKKIYKQQTIKKHVESFIKKIWDGKAEEAHSQFVRFGKGVFAGRAALSLNKGSSIKLGGSFEYVSEFAILVSELDANAKFSGIILSKIELSGMSGKKKSGIIEYEVTDFQASKIQEIKDKIYALLLDAEGNGISLKSKKKLPKPGKSGELKIDDKFAVIEADLKYWDKIKEAFMFPECKKCKVNHTISITEIIIPKDEKDFEKARILAKRKGKITRKLNIDKTEKQEERDFCA